MGLDIGLDDIIDIAIPGASIISGLLASDAAGDQADAYEDASRASVAEQRRQFNLIRSDTEPYREVGQNALYSLSGMLGLGGQQFHERQNRLSDLREKLSGTDKFLTTGGHLKTQYSRTDPHSFSSRIGWRDAPIRNNKGSATVHTRQVFVPEETSLNPEFTRLQEEIASLEAQIEQTGGEPSGGGFDVSQLPGYQFRFDQGINALNNSLAASGNRFSGRAMKAAQRYGQGVASQAFGNAFNRRAALAGVGQTAVGQSGTAGMAAAGNIGNALFRGGVGAANARASGMASINNAIQGGIGNYLSYRQSQQLLNALGDQG